jgi:hypothetical protein
LHHTLSRGDIGIGRLQVRHRCLELLLRRTELAADAFELLQREVDDVECRGCAGRSADIDRRHDCSVTRPWTVAAVVPACASVVVAVPPAASVPVPEKLAIEMLSPDALVRISLFAELTVAVIPVVPVFSLIALTSPARPDWDTLVTVAVI